MDRDQGLYCAIKGFMHAIAFRIHSRKFFMHEFHYAKEHVIARTFHKAFRLIRKYLLLGMLAATALEAQQSPPSPQAWAGVVRTTAGEPVAGAKVTVFSSGAKKNPTAVTGTDGRFAIADLRPGPNRVSVQMPGRGPTGQVVVNITSVTIVLTVSDQNVLSIDANPQSSAGASNGNPSTTSNPASGTSGEKLSSQKVNELPLNGRDYSTMVLLAAGTMTDVNGQTNFTQQFAINGQRGVEAVFAMDDADVSDPEMSIKLRLDAGGHRARRGWFYQYRDPIRQKRFSRVILRVLKELCPRCAELFRSPVDCGPRPNPSVPPKRVRFYEWRAGRVAASV